MYIYRAPQNKEHEFIDNNAFGNVIPMDTFLKYWGTIFNTVF